MKNGELYGIHMILAESLKLARSFKLIYAVNKNLDRVQSELKALEATKKSSEKYDEFNQKRIALCVVSAAKDDKGQPKTINTANGQEYDIVDRPAFDKALEVLREEYKDAVEEHKVSIASFNKRMDEENEEFKVYKIKYSILVNEQEELKPEQRLDGAQVRSLWFMIEDDMEDTQLKMIK